MAKDASLKVGQSDMIGSIVTTAGNLISGFNYKQQENNIKIAELQAEAAKAQAEAANSSNNNSNNKMTYIILGIVALVVVVLILKK